MIRVREVAVGRGGERGPGGSAVEGAKERHAARDHDVRIHGVHPQNVVPITLRSAVIGTVKARPVLSAVGGLVKAQQRGKRAVVFDAGVNRARGRRRDGQRGPSDVGRWKHVRPGAVQPIPGDTSIGGLVHTVDRSAGSSDQDTPQRGVDHARIERIEHHVAARGPAQHQCPTSSAVGRAIDPPVGRVVTDHGRQEDVRIGWVDGERPDGGAALSENGRVQSERAHEWPGKLGPRGPGIDRLENPRAIKKGVVRFAGSHVNDVRIGWCERNGTDGERDLIVGNRRPVLSAIEGFPDAPLCSAEVQDVIVARIDRQGSDAARGEGRSARAQSRIEVDRARPDRCPALRRSRPPA